MTPEDFERFRADRDAERDRDLQSVLALPEGRRLLWRIISELGCLHELSFARDDRNTCVLEGRRSVGLALYQECQRVAPGHHVHMVTDSLSRQQQDRLLAEATRDGDGRSKRE